jgi:hypothetical protein
LGGDRHRDRQARYCIGYDPDWFMPPLLAERWCSWWYPREKTCESVEQWVRLIDQIRVEYLGPFNNPQRAAEMRVERANDLDLIREHDPHLLENGTRPVHTVTTPDDGKTAAGATQATGAPSEPILLPEHFAILEALQHVGTALTPAAIARALSRMRKDQRQADRAEPILTVSKRSIEQHSKPLLEHGLVARPGGTQRKGFAITEKGRQRLAARGQPRS